MIDFHNHIIPNLDDGSKSIEMSLNMIREAEAQGITDIVNTVHYQHPKMEKKDTSYEFIKNEINKFQKIVYDNNIKIKIHSASEVFFKFNLTEILDNPITTFGDGKYMLIEFQRLSFPDGYEDEIFKVQLKGIVPIIAHPERYRGIQKDISLAQKWVDRGYLIQIDCSSILGGFGKETQESAIKLLDNGLCHLIGSDAHNDKNRNFLLKQTILEIEKIIGNDSTLIVKNNSYKILNGQEVLSYSNVNEKTSIFSKISSFFS
ncbi:MAG: CpsB/CapC family capsule biosynthesis tyrosine phosphatase [Candidatus Neomarinimicrobiota bacterium]|nr:CpsB/CapC family capsule biosynthesis tyrosine phosphatase [Candidatus Neomarinimicrobiota bacterium]